MLWNCLANARIGSAWELAHYQHWCQNCIPLWKAWWRALHGTTWGFSEPGQEHKVLCLKHTIYGLKQAALKWWEVLDESMAALGFKCLLSDSGVFVYISKGKGTVELLEKMGPWVTEDQGDWRGANETNIKEWDSNILTCRGANETKVKMRSSAVNNNLTKQS